MSTLLHFLLPHTWWLNVIAALIIHGAWCIFEGEREAYYYSRVDNPKLLIPLPNAHPIFVFNRIAVWAILGLLCGPLIVLAAMLIFPFFHDGYYYAGRNTFLPEKYPDRFTSEPSKTSEAVMDISYRTRTIMFLAGLVLWIGTTWYAATH
jgi:hypothetical protein